MPVLSGPQVAACLKSAGFGGEDLVIGVAVAKAESGWRTDATNNNRNGTQDRGLMQINSIHPEARSNQIFDPNFNARAAMRIFRDAKNRWQPWSTFNAGRHTRYMAEARQAVAGVGNVAGNATEGATQQAITYGPLGPQIVVAGPGVAYEAVAARNGPLNNITLYGGQLTADIARRVTGEVKFAGSFTEIPHLQITIADQGGEVFGKFGPLFTRGTKVRYMDLEMVISDGKFTSGDTGLGQIELTAIDGIAWNLMQVKGPRAADGQDATTFLAAECVAAKMDPKRMFLGERVPSQSQLARDVAAQGAATTQAAAPAGIAGQVFYDDNKVKLDADDKAAVAGVKGTTHAYVTVPNRAQLGQKFSVEDKVTNKKVAATGGDVAPFGTISRKCATDLGMKITGAALPTHRVIITAAVEGAQGQAAATPGAAQQQQANTTPAARHPGEIPTPGGVARIIEDTLGKPESEEPSAWTTGTRLAKELGKRFFISGKRLYFGAAGFTMTWAADIRAQVPQLYFYGPDDRYRFLEMPEITRTSLGNLKSVIQIKGKVPLWRAPELRVGVPVKISGIPALPLAAMQTYFQIAAVEHSLGVDVDGMDVTFIQPLDAPPEPPQAQGGQQGGGAPEGGTGSIDRMISLMLAQTGDRYVFGINVNPNDPNPSAFDCAELTSWAAWQAGIRPRLTPGSQAQRAECKRFRQISVRQAINTKGALLFTSGHVAASLGNGKTIEAYQTGKPVGQRDANPPSKWADAGLVPGAAGYRLGPP